MSRSSEGITASGALGAGFAVAPSRKFRKRFLAVSIAGLAVLAASLGVSFAGDSGTASLSVTGGNSNFVYKISAAGDPLPTAVTSLETGFSTVASHAIASPVTPSWTPVAGSAGSVTTPGDLAVIDASTSSLVLNVYITNLAALQADYSSFSLPIDVYSSACSSTCTWAQDSTVVGNTTATYITNSAGVVTLSLPAGKYYEIVMATGTAGGGSSAAGGAFYCISTTASTGSLSPSFYFVATAT